MSIFFERATLRELVYSMSERFVPTRLILLNYWLYQRQVFYFASGKLFLTGDNGSGKSTALTAAITSIFDGDTSPSRMDPFGGGKRSVRYYLLGDREAGFEYDSRRAYIALEFQNPDGGFVTVGLGLQASAGSRDLQKWGFAVSERIEHDNGISLVSSENTPLSRRQLREAFNQTDGRVVESVEEYAKLVRRTLYPKSNDEEYSKLLELLMTIRGAKLGREVRPSEIERLLRLSLSRLDPAILEQLREGIEGMDRHQRRLEVLEAQVGAGSRIATAFFEAALARLTAADAAQTQAETQVQNLRLEQQTLQQKLELLRQEIATQNEQLESANSEQTALDLERDTLEAQLQNADGALRDAETKLEETRVAVKAEQDRLRRAKERLERTQERRTERHAEQQSLTQRGSELEQQLARVAWYSSPDSLPERRSALDAAQTAWRRFDADTERLSEREMLARKAKSAVETAREQLESDTLYLEQVIQQTSLTLQEQASAVFAQVPREYIQALTTQLDPSEALPWLEPLAAAQSAHLQQQRDDTQSSLRLQQDLHHSLQQQIIALESADEAVPPLPKQRAQAVQALEKAGIKHQILYQCLRPKGKTDVAGLESGLLHSGVLTALVVAEKDRAKASKTLRSSQLEDALLQLSGGADGLQLTAYLEPEPDAPEMVVQWLAQAQTFALDGTWQQGALHGVSTPNGVRFLGAAARESERQRQLTTLRQDLADVEVALGLAQEDFTTASQALQDFTRAWNALQNPKSERQSRQKADAARQTSAARFEDRTRAEVQALEALAIAQTAAASATNALEQVLQPLGLPTQQNALNTALSELSQTETTARDLAQNSRDQQQLQDALSELETDLEARSSEIAELEKSRLELENKREQLTSRVQEMRAQLENPDIKAWRERLGRVRNRLSELRGWLRELERSQTKNQSELELCQTRLPALLGQLENANQLLERRSQQRQAAAARHPHIEEKLVATRQSPESLEQIARDLEYTLKDVFDAQKHHLEYPESFTPVLENHLPRFLLEGQSVTPDALTAHLASELEEAQRLLSEEEARIFHNELVFALAEKLYSQILEARAFVKNIRQTLSDLRFHDERLDLELHRTSDSPIAELLDGKMKPENQTDAQREQFANTVRDLVARLRSQPNPDISFPQALEQALDYRQWYGFTFYSIVGERRVEITDRKFQSRSGGERSAVLYTFMFAALGARFAAMGSTAPRLIGLDEAFAGMDPHNIAALYRIMASLELSLIATSPSDIYLSRSLEVASAYRLFRVSSGDADGVSSLARLWNGSRAIDMGM